MNFAAMVEPAKPATKAKGSTKPTGGGPGNRITISRRTQVIATSVLALAALGWGVWHLWSNRVIPPTADAKSVATFVASSNFTKLSPEEQAKYLETNDKLREAMRDLPDDVRRGLWENLREVRENQQLDEYFKLSPEERKKYLDQQIDEEEKRRKQWQERAATRPTSRPAGWGPGGPGGTGGGGGDRGGNRGGPGGRGSAERQKAGLENRSPARRAQSAQMRADMAQRRAERGIPDPVRGRGPGGGGGGSGGNNNGGTRR